MVPYIFYFKSISIACLVLYILVCFMLCLFCINDILLNIPDETYEASSEIYSSTGGIDTQQINIVPEINGKFIFKIIT